MYPCIQSNIVGKVDKENHAPHKRFGSCSKLYSPSHSCALQLDDSRVFMLTSPAPPLETILDLYPPPQLTEQSDQGP